ncbi:hypothetical protein [Paenibacillus piri]|nr:hypothetical protein [Paenibacillus piri]
MSSQFTLANLSPELLSELKHFEERIRADANQNIVLIAYSEETAAKKK